MTGHQIVRDAVVDTMQYAYFTNFVKMMGTICTICIASWFLELDTGLKPDDALLKAHLVVQNVDPDTISKKSHKS